jgi:UV radiation resistance-associated gene protein
VWVSVRGAVLVAGFDDEAVASALGWTCQLVLLIAGLYGVPLPYAMLPRASRSLVRDDVSASVVAECVAVPLPLLICTARCDQALTRRGSDPLRFPLYARNVERFKFNYAVYLLNKNVEQARCLGGPRPI